MNFSMVLKFGTLALLILTGSARAEVCSYYWDDEVLPKLSRSEQIRIERALFAEGRKLVRVAEKRYAELLLRFSVGGSGGLVERGKTTLFYGVDLTFQDRSGRGVYQNSDRLPFAEGSARPSVFELLLLAAKEAPPCERIAHERF